MIATKMKKIKAKLPLITVPQSNIRKMNPHPPVEEISGDVDGHIVDGPWRSIGSPYAVVSITVRRDI